MRKSKVLWLAPYPVHLLKKQIKWMREPGVKHPCSWIMNLLHALVQLDHLEIHIVTLCPEVSCHQSVDLNGYTLHIIKSGVPLLSRGYPSYMPWDVITGFRSDAKKIKHVLCRIDPDLVHIHGTEAAYAVAGSKFKGLKVLSVQGVVAEYYKTDPCFRFKKVAKIEERVVQKVFHFTCRTHFDKSFIRRTNPGAQIFHIEEAMHPLFFEHSWKESDELRVLFVGSSEKRKGLFDLIRVIEGVSVEIPNITLEVAGHVSAEFKERVEQEIIQKDFSIRYHGFCTPNDLSILHRSCSVFVIPSVNENSPNSLAEAMVSGMPIIAYNVGGISSMFENGKSGILVEAGDVQGLAGALAYVLLNPDESKKMGHEARELGKRNKPITVAKETLRMYEKILNSGSTTP